MEINFESAGQIAIAIALRDLDMIDGYPAPVISIGVYKESTTCILFGLVSS